MPVYFTPSLPASAQSSVPPIPNPRTEQEHMMQNLPRDIQKKLLSLMDQADIAHLATSCRVFNELAKPLLRRELRCVSCQTALFHPRELQPSDVSAARIAAQTVYRITSKLPRRSFFQLRDRSPDETLSALGMQLDTRRGAANFHVLRHLAQTLYRNERFPLPQELQAVRALRCLNCKVFVGFRHDDPTTGTTHDFVHHDFLELVDGDGRHVTLSGAEIPDLEGTVRCARHGCQRVLFDRDDVLPWSHVLASTRLTDMDAYLEWDHSWSGAATASQPAFFVKRMRAGAGVVRNVRVEHMRQGDMEIGDVHCAKCDAQIGWKFLKELPDEDGGGLLQNYDQIGRFGIIRTSVAPVEPRFG